MNTLIHRVSLSFILLVLITISSVFGAMFLQGKPALINEHQKLIKKSGQLLISKLENSLNQIEKLTVNLSLIANTLPKDKAIYHQAFPTFINDFDNKAIAGGGIWPEPYVFDSEVSRHSFFWARGNNNSLQLLDDYNIASGSGYHQEDWYLSGKTAQEGKCVWSPAYSARIA